MPNRLVAQVAFAAAASSLLAACPPAYPKCDKDEQCAEKGEVCVQAQCRECATDANCKPGFVCDANTCVPRPECSDQLPCPAQKKCEKGKCLVDPNAKGNGACSVNEDCPSGEECRAGRCASKGLAQCSLEPIRFEFNESKLAAENQTALATLADCIKKNGWKLRLEGHADERGTEEYNLQLSNRRAASVKVYLAHLGVPEADLDALGFGENKPLVLGSTEEAWAANRRVELIKR